MFFESFLGLLACLLVSAIVAAIFMQAAKTEGFSCLASVAIAIVGGLIWPLYVALFGLILTIACVATVGYSTYLACSVIVIALKVIVTGGRYGDVFVVADKHIEE